ncbi:MAG: hypothetical protein HY053_02870 [Proteobacteria bacterium]|nr:hypothetical protein [Pseudomonadota bacterium]
MKKFYSPALGNLMHATRKSDLKYFVCDAQSVCRIEDGNTNAYLREDRAVEEFLKSIEPKYTSSLEKVREDKIDEECIYTLAGFVSYITTCSPTGMRIPSGDWGGEYSSANIYFR